MNQTSAERIQLLLNIYLNFNNNDIYSVDTTYMFVNIRIEICNYTLHKNLS
jgi:hypothetical protein